jgi:hypothetical protein
MAYGIFNVFVGMSRPAHPPNLRMSVDTRQADKVTTTFVVTAIVPAGPAPLQPELAERLSGDRTQLVKLESGRNNEVPTYCRCEKSCPATRG